MNPVMDLEPQNPSGAPAQGFAMCAHRSVDVELPGSLRRRVFFDENNEVTHVWLIPHGGKQTERNIRPGTKAWDAAVEAARAADAVAGTERSL